MKTRIFLFLCFVFSTACFAQMTSITAKTFVTKNNTVIIRFAPATKTIWELGNKNGYSIERIKIEDDIFPDSSAFAKAAFMFGIKPFPVNDTNWVSLIKTDATSAFVYQSLYPQNKTPVDPKKALDNFNLVLLSCDLSTAIAKACGLFFEDKISDAPGIYAYRIKITGSKYSTITSVDSRKPTQLKNINDLKGKFENRIVKLSWNVSENKGDYAAYIIERSEDSLNFTRTNKTPYVQLYSSYEKNKTTAYYTDSLPQNGKIYFYRIKGLSHFGETGLPSKTVKGKGKEELTVFPIIDSSRVIDNKKVALYWKMPKIIDPKKLKGFAVTRSDKTNGNYSSITATILEPNATSFIDEQPMFTNYYIIQAINLDDDSAHSFPVLAQLKDKDPPLPPSGLTGTINDSGIVRLKWNANSETDLKGYRVFRCNSLKEEFVEVTKEILKTPNFKDAISLETLTRDVFYEVTAVDRVFNNSKYSEPLRLKRPDIVPPVAPVLTSVTHNDTAIVLKWIPSTSNDVDFYELFKLESGKALENKIYSWKPSDSLTTYIDTGVVSGKTYTYSMDVVDSASNVTSSTDRTVIFESGIRDKIKDIKFVVDREGRKITLNWTYSEKNIFNYVIYKSKKGEALRIWKTVKGNVNTIEDTELYIDNIYIYKIKAVLTNGSESKLSEPIEVNY